MKYTIEQVEKKYGKGLVIKYFDSLDAYHKYLKPRVRVYNTVDRRAGHSLDYEVEQLITGQKTNTPKIRALLDQMRESEIFSTGLPMPETHYAGSRPNIGAYLTGRPKNMYRRQSSENSALNTPINIYININLSHDLDGETFVKKGCAIAALALSLSTTRPVSIYTVKPLYTGWKKPLFCISMVKVNDSTINMERLDFAMTNRSYHGELSWTSIAHIMKEQHGESFSCPGSWPFNQKIETKEYDDCVKACVGYTPNDIFIPGSASYNEAMTNNPVAWVKKQIETHKTNQTYSEDRRD